MLKATITPCSLKGEMQIPSSKSQTMRSLLFAMMAKGKSTITNPLPSLDTFSMIDAIRKLGAKVDMDGDLCIEGVGGKLKPAADVIDCGNSGQVLRFIGALAALSPSYTILTGDLSIRKSRPILPLIDGLLQLGAFASSSKLDGFAPLIVKGPISKKFAKIQGEDSQPVSSLLMLGAFYPLEIEVIHPGETPWIELTLSWLNRLGIPYENDNFTRYRTEGNWSLKPFDYHVPADFSSAAFPLIGALITHSNVTLKNLDPKEVQGDKKILDVLQEMGADLSFEKSALQIKQHNTLKGISIDVNHIIDAIPILAVLGCFAKGTTELYNGEIARHKESDRLFAITKELKKMGAHIEETKGGLIIQESLLKGAHLSAHQDHRIAMALSIAAMGAKGTSVIHGVECVKKSYPTFFHDLSQIGAQIELDGPI